MAARSRVRWSVPAVGALLVAGCATIEPPAPLASLVPPDLAERGTLLVATDPTFPPAQFPAPTRFQDVQTGRYTGFEVGLVEAAADRLGLDVAWVDLPFVEVLEAVASGDADMGAAAITLTDERAAEVAFVTFFEAGSQWVTAQPNTVAVTPNSACGARVAVQAGTVQEQDVQARSAACEQNGRDPIVIRIFERQDEATAAVLAGVADAFVADEPAAAWAIQQAGTTGSAAGAVTGRLGRAGSPYDVEPYGWAFDPESSGLAEAMLAALQDVVSDGDYLEILSDWGVSSGALDADDIELRPARAP
jgi:polar amino acid transport system substrate-binding protein